MLRTGSRIGDHRVKIRLKCFPNSGLVGVFGDLGWRGLVLPVSICRLVFPCVRINDDLWFAGVWIFKVVGAHR
jgi:hypothetical protein